MSLLVSSTKVLYASFPAQRGRLGDVELTYQSNHYSR